MGERRIVKGYYLPPGFIPSNSFEFRDTILSDTLALREVVPSAVLLQELVIYIRNQGSTKLSRIPLKTIINTLDQAAEEWLDVTPPEQSLVIDAMTAATGFSKQMVIESLRVEQESSRAADIWRTIQNEFGNFSVLDEFTWREDAAAYVRAVGPELVGCFLPGNIPGLSHLPIMRALLVKSPIICKTSRSEPVYAAAYARTLAKINIDIAECLAVLYWLGGNEILESVVFKNADAIIAYGNEQTCASVADRVRPNSRLFLHSHKLGFVVIDDKAMKHGAAQLASALAYDIAMFDQQACLSPQWIFTESEISGHEIASLLADELRLLENKLPTGIATIDEKALFNRQYDDMELSMLLNEGVTLYSQRGKDRFMVAVAVSAKILPGNMGRSIIIVPWHDLERLEILLGPFKGYFQNVALQVDKDIENLIIEMMARIGVSRICAPGRMATPTMMWHHDGRSCLSELVHFSDKEGP